MTTRDIVFESLRDDEWFSLYRIVIRSGVSEKRALKVLEEMHSEGQILKRAGLNNMSDYRRK